MAERIMAEATSGPEGEAKIPPGVPKAAYELSQAKWGGKNPLESFKGQLNQPPGLTPDEWRDVLRSLGIERPQPRQPSIFQNALARIEVLQRQPQSAERDTNLQAAINRLDIMLRNAIDNGVLIDIRDVIRGIYTEATSTAPTVSSEPDYSPPSPGGSNLRTLNDRIKFVREALADYQETFWEYGNAELASRFRGVDVELRRREYEGTAKYVAQKMAIAIEKELKGIPPSPDEFGDLYLTVIKTELEGLSEDRERRRRELRRRVTADERLDYSTWRERFNFNWAETPEELRDSVFDWLEKFRLELPDEAPEKVDEAIREGRRNALSALKQAENRLNKSPDTRLHIPLGSVLDREFRDTMQAYVDAIGGVRLLESEGGFEAYTGLLEDFAYNFNAHNGSIILGNEKSAIMQDFLAENDGEFSLGAPPTIEKPQEGDITEFRGNIEWQAKRHAATHELYIRKADFENAQLGEGEIRREVALLNLPAAQAEQAVQQRLEARRREKELGEVGVRRAVERLNLPRDQAEQIIRQRIEEIRRDRRYGWGEDDVVEELLLTDARDMARAQALTDPQRRAEALAKVGVRTRVFQRIKARLDKEDIYRGGSLADLNEDQRKEAIRTRIRQKMQQEGNRTRRQEIDALPDDAVKDKALWEWVQQFNRLREKYGAETWYPSSWDMVRLSIDRSTKLVDRVLKKINKAQEMRNLDPAEADAIRTTIRQEMTAQGDDAEVQRINALLSPLNKDKALWRWVDNFNALRKSRGEQPWYASEWDRALPASELKAMVEEIEDPYKDLTEEQTRNQINREFREAIEREVAQRNLPVAQANEEINRMMEAVRGRIAERVDDVLFDQQRRMSEAERAFNINVIYQKFLGVQARWGGQVVRVLDENGNMVLKTVSSMARDILKAKIDKEEEDIEEKVTAFEPEVTAKILTRVDIPGQLQILEQQLTAQGLSQAEIDQRRNTLQQQLQAHVRDRVEVAKLQKTRFLRRDATFGATLALREIGLANDLPIWNYYYYNDPQRIQAFAPLVGYTHERKPEIVELLDRGRREMGAVDDYLADTYMDGTILTVVDNEDTNQHEEHWDRSRVINQAGELALREVFDARWMLSTSGAIKNVRLISKTADLGIDDLLWEMGCWTFQDFQGLMQRRDEVERKRQSFWNTTKWRDPITYAQRLRGARAAIPFLRGGEVRNQGLKPGMLQEALMGAWRHRDVYIKGETWIGGTFQRDAVQRDPKGTFKENIQKMLEKEANLSDIDPLAIDELVRIGGEILVTVIDYMNARRYVMNRAGFAPKNWEADNELIFKAWAEEVLRREPLMDKAGKIIQDIILGGAEKLGDAHMGYAVQGRSAMSVEVYRKILRESSYHMMEQADAEALDERAGEVKKEMDVKREEIEARGLPAEVQRRINARIAKLQAKHTTQANLDRERARLGNLYIDEQLHKEFVGEWPARFEGICAKPEPKVV